MDKYYRVKKDTFVWKEGAILKAGNYNDGYSSHVEYTSIEDVWNVVPDNSERISARVVEAVENKDIFERVYKDTLGGNLFRTASQMVTMYKEAFKVI